MSLISDNRNKRKQKQQRAQVVATTPKTPPQQTYSTPVGAETQGQGYQQYTTPQQQATPYYAGYHPSGVDAGAGLVTNHPSYQYDAMPQQAQPNAQGTASAPVMDVPTTQAPPPTQVGFHASGIEMPNGYSATRPNVLPDEMPQGQSSAPYQGQLDNAVNGVYARRMGGAGNYATQPADNSTGAPVMEVARPTDKEPYHILQQPYMQYVGADGMPYTGNPNISPTPQDEQVQITPYQQQNFFDGKDTGILAQPHPYSDTTPSRQTMGSFIGSDGVVGAEQKARGAMRQNIPANETSNIQALDKTNRMLAEQEGQPKSKVDQQMDAIKQAQDAQAEKERTTFNPKKKSVPSFLNGLLRAPRTEAERRDQITKITTLGNLLRHAANLYYVGEKDATPQTIADQNAINQAQWASEDKAAADKAAKEAEAKRKQDELDWKKAYQQYQLNQGDRNIAIRMADHDLKANADKRAEEMHPWNMASKAAGIEQAKASTEKIKTDNELAPKKFAEEVRSHKENERQGRQRVAQGWARIALDRQKEARIAAEGGGYSSTGKKLKNGWEERMTPSGTRYYISPTLKKNSGVIYDEMVKKGLIKPEQDANGKDVRPTKEGIMDKIMEVADDPNGHDDFVFYAKRAGYKYVDGSMSDETRKRLHMNMSGLKI